MKKILSVILAVVMVLTCAVTVFAADTTDSVIKFNSDGKFKIMMINDTQDVGKGNKEQTVKFIEKALDTENPDLVVFVGDQLADIYPAASKEDYKKAIDNVVKPLADRNIPFLVTLGNHDHDRANLMSEEEMFEYYASYPNCISVKGSTDPFTNNTLVYGSDGETVAFNIYMMDTNNTGSTASYTGIYQNQLDWYNAKSAELKAANGGEAVPSLLFQHVPVKEIYGLLKECDWDTDGAIYSRRDHKWYVLNEELAEGDLGEAPCSEDFDIVTGEYQAWIANGDIMGAFFAHDHNNNFVGTSVDGIKMGYNGGVGFRAYGAECGRTIRVFNLDESDVTNYETHLIYYNTLMGEKASNPFFDTFSPAILNKVMKVVYALFGWAIKLFNSNVAR